MIKIGITGQNGFVGTHLTNYFSINKEEYKLVNFEKDFFSDEDKLDQFVTGCDVIIHLAALNRHNDPEVIYETNTGLVEKLIASFTRTNSKPHVLFSSSSQEERDNLYGKSKKDGRELFVKWAEENDAVFTGMIIPNVFGPFGNPYYNSFIATFSHQLTHGEQPKIDNDAEIKLIYINQLVREFEKAINEKINDGGYWVSHQYVITVSSVLEKLESYKRDYFDNQMFPEFKDSIDLDLFNTFRSYIDPNYFPQKLKLNTDDRGSFVETVKSLGQGQFSFSTTVPGITRGNHFHTRKVERFAVIKGKALIELRRTGSDEVLSYELDGEQPSYVDMPVWYTHNIKNTGSEELLTLFWINEFFDPEDPDTFYETV